MKIENKLAILPNTEATKIINNTHIEFIKDVKVSEKNVDSKVQSILIDKLGFTENEAILAVTKLPDSDIEIPSKTVKASGTGEIDCAVFINKTLKIIIEDKKPTESIDLALEEAIFYADGLNKKGEDIRIAIGYNGIELKLRVLDHTSNKWVPFYINGKEVKSFIGKELLNIIYYQKDIHGIVVEEVNEDINIKDIISNLKTIYRNIELQNDNQKTIDFTIAFIGLKSVLEKYINENIRGLKSWENLNPKKNPNDNNSTDDEELRDNLINVVDKIFEKIGNEYTDLFIIKDSENIEQFNFKNTLLTFTTDYDLKSLRKIYFEISRLYDLHNSKIDLFGEVYEALGDNSTKKAFGQYFTRRHIIKTLIELMEIDINDFVGTVEEEVKKGKIIKTANRPKKVCDPACGTGGFITEFFKSMLEKINQNKEYKDINLSDLANKSFYGYDIYTSNVSRTKINMYLAGDGFSEIRKADTLQDTEIESNKFDFIITNPPYGKGTTTVNYTFFEENEEQERPVLNNTRLEVNFLVKIVDMLKPNGKAMAIIPDGVLEATTLSPLRKWFLQHCRLEKVVGLPKHAFAPYTHEKTYAIFFQKRSEVLEDLEEVKNDSNVWCYLVDNDGFANSDKRFRTDRMDENGKYIHDEFSQWRNLEGKYNPSLIIERYKRKTQLDNEKFYNEWNEEIKGTKYGYISMNEILEDEFINYPTKSKSDILKLINNNIDDKYNIDNFIKNENLSQEEEILRNETLYKIENLVRFEENTYYDLSSQKTYSSRDLVNLINENVEENLKIRTNKDLIEDKKIKTEYVKVLKTLNIKYDVLKTTPKFFVPNKYNEIKEGKLKKIITDTLKVSDISEIFEDNEIIEKYQTLLNEKNIEYDLFEDKFFDMNKKIVTKTLVFAPEKYFRQDKPETISLKDMKKSNEDLLEDITKLLKDLKGE